MTKIEQLESEINQKTNELNKSLNAQYSLRETLKSNTETMKKIENLLKVMDANLKHSNEYICTLKQENLGLKLSCDEWMKRSIKLEFEILNARDGTKIDRYDTCEKFKPQNISEVQRIRRCRQLTQEAWLMFQKIFDFWHTSCYKTKDPGRLYNLTDRAYKRYKRRSLKLLRLSYPMRLSDYSSLKS